MLGSANIDNVSSKEDAGEDEKERRTDSVPDLKPHEVQDDGGLGAASQMVQNNEPHSKNAHPVQCRNMFGSCVLLSYAGHFYLGKSTTDVDSRLDTNERKWRERCR
jgi:hypothetical protein